MIFRTVGGPTNPMYSRASASDYQFLLPQPPQTTTTTNNNTTTSGSSSNNTTTTTTTTDYL